MKNKVSFFKFPYSLAEKNSLDSNVINTLPDICVCVYSCCCSLSKSCLTFCEPMDCSPLSMEFSRQESWSRFSFPFPGNLCDPVIKPPSPALPECYIKLPRGSDPQIEY